MAVASVQGGQRGVNVPCPEKRTISFLFQSARNLIRAYDALLKLIGKPQKTFSLLGATEREVLLQAIRIQTICDRILKKCVSRQEENLKRALQITSSFQQISRRFKDELESEEGPHKFQKQRELSRSNRSRTKGLSNLHTVAETDFFERTLSFFIEQFLPSFLDCYHLMTQEQKTMIEKLQLVMKNNLEKPIEKIENEILLTFKGNYSLFLEVFKVFEKNGIDVGVMKALYEEILQEEL